MEKLWRSYGSIFIHGDSQFRLQLTEKQGLFRCTVSPISPILFLIYIRELFPRIAAKVLSYIDNISLIVTSTSLKKNIRILQKEAEKIFELEAKDAIQFDLVKTELMYFNTRKEAKTASLRLLNGNTAQLKELVRWLSIQFVLGLSFK